MSDAISFTTGSSEEELRNHFLALINDTAGTTVEETSTKDF
jgi:hypothetical protein